MTVDEQMQQIEETERLIAVYRNADEVIVGTQDQIYSRRGLINRTTLMAAEIGGQIVSILERRLVTMRAELKKLGTEYQEILFCFAGKGTIIVDGVPHPFVPGTTVYAAPGVRHKIISDGPDELKMTWTYLPPGLDDFFAAIGRPREPGEPAPEPFARPADVHAIEARTGYGAPIEG